MKQKTVELVSTFLFLSLVWSRCVGPGCDGRRESVDAEFHRHHRQRSEGRRSLYSRFWL